MKITMKSYIKRLEIVLTLGVIFAFLPGFDFSAYDTGGNIIIDNGSKITIIGDSRTVNGYHDTLDDRVNWMACAGTDYNVFSEYYVPLLDGENLKGNTIVIAYGVNDLQNNDLTVALNNWLLFYNGKAQEWIKRGAKIKVLSVPGMDYGMCRIHKGVVLENSVDEFNVKTDVYNAYLQENLPKNIEFIQTIPTNEVEFVDGIHYTLPQSIQFYEDVIDSLVKKGKK